MSSRGCTQEGKCTNKYCDAQTELLFVAHNFFSDVLAAVFVIKVKSALLHFYITVRPRRTLEISQECLLCYDQSQQR